MKPAVKEVIETILIFAIGVFCGWCLQWRPLEEPPYPIMVPKFFSRPINSTGGGF